MTFARLLFMGSDPFSVPALAALLARERSPALPVEVIGVITQPDRPAGRGRRLTGGPVKQLAEEYGRPVLQPERLRESEATAEVLALLPEVIVVAAYGQLLPGSLVDAPAHACLNLHPSLLPRFRGPTPVAGALLAGEEVTGVTVMRLVRRMDAGPIVRQRSTSIAPDETTGELEGRLAVMGAELLVECLPAWLTGALPPHPQNDAMATYTSLLTKEQGRLVWSTPAAELARQVRAYNPWPGATTTWQERTVRLLRARAVPGDALPGQVAGESGGSLLIGSGEGLLAVSEMQLAGGRALPAGDLLRGNPGLLDARLV